MYYIGSSLQEIKNKLKNYMINLNILLVLMLSKSYLDDINFNN